LSQHFRNWSQSELRITRFSAILSDKKHNEDIMKFIPVFLFAFLLEANANAQIFKKHIIEPPSPLDSIKISENFVGEYLDSVYNFLSYRYGLKIIYDTSYCSTIPFYYWFLETSASRAIEITTRETDLSYQIDSTLTIYVKAKHFHNIRRKRPVSLASKTDQVGEKDPKINFSLSGHAFDDSTNETLSGVYISIKNTSLGTTTNADGSYILMNVPSDTVTLLVSYMGYVQNEVPLNSKINRHEFNIGLQPDPHMLKEAIVIGNRADIMNMSANTISTIKLTPSKLAEIPNVGEKDVMRTFQLMPGISAANESSSGLYVRGGTPDQNLVLYDGFTVYQVDHLYGFFSAFNANAVKEVDLYKGGFSAKYGGRLSSITDISGKEGSTKQFNLGGDLSLLSANLFTEIPVTENLSVVAAARRSWNGPIYNWIFNSFNHNTGSQSSNSGGRPGGANNVVKAKSYFYDINTRVTFKPTKKDVFTYSFFNGSDDLNNSFKIETPSFLANMGISLNFGTTDVTTYSNTGMSTIWQREWTKKLRSNTSLSYSNFESDRKRLTTGSVSRSGSDTTSSETGIFEHNNLKDVSLRSDYDWDIAQWNHISFGIFATQYDINYTYSHSDTDLLVDNHHNSLLAGGYLQDQFIFFRNKLTITPGARLSYFEATQQQYIEPRLALNYNITKHISFKSAYGKFYQFANRITRDDISVGSSQFWVLSDKSTVPVSSSIHYIAGLSYETPNFLFGVEGYYKLLSDISLYTEKSSATTSSINYNQDFYVGKGYSKGIEFTAQKKMGKFTGWVSYTLAKTMYQFDVYSAGYFPADQDVRNEFKIVSMYKMHHWDFAITWIYASGRPYTAPGGSYSVKLLDGTTENYVTVTSKNTLRLPDYHRMDVAVNYHFYNEAKKDIGYIGLSLFNVYARENVWYKQYTVVDNYVVSTNVNYLGFTPNLTLSLKIR
jgi:ferric enterobactin receptor